MTQCRHPLTRVVITNGFVKLVIFLACALTQLLVGLIHHTFYISSAHSNSHNSVHDQATIIYYNIYTHAQRTMDI